MTETEFNALAAQGYNRIPVTLETFADLDTPLSIYLKLANAPYTDAISKVVFFNVWEGEVGEAELKVPFILLWLAGAALFLASDLSGGMSSQVLTIRNTNRW